MTIKRLRLGLLVVTCSLFLATLFGLPSVAFAEGNIEGNNNNAYLTKVLSLKDTVQVRNGTDADTYEFTFAGSGTVGTDLTSDGVQQVSPLEAGDTVPVLGTDGKVTLNALSVNTENNSTHKNGEDNSTFIYVIRQSLKEIVTASGVTFSKPGIYTYRVTETAVNKIVSPESVGVNPSQASYLMKVSVIYDSSTKTHVPVDIAVEKEKDDEGNADSNDVYQQNNRKVDPSYPRVSTDDPTLIDNTATGPANISASDLAPDSRGRNVYGFTFANEYVIGMAFKVKKEVAGEYGDRNKKFEVKVKLGDEAAPDNCRYVYQVVSKQSDGTWVGGDRKAAYFSNKWTTIAEQLKDGDYISVIGLQGYYAGNQSKTDDTSQEDLSSSNSNRTWLGNGVVPNTPYVIEEGAYEHYRASVYAFNDQGAESITHATTNYSPQLLKSGSVNAKVNTGEKMTGATDKTIIVLNTYDDASTSFTGIVINNLPYILMIGIPVGILAIKIVGRLRAGEEAA